MTRARRVAWAWAGALLLAGATIACGPSMPAEAPEGELRYPGILHAPGELSPDFAVEQHVEIRKGEGTGGFDAVLQKRAGELVIVGLGPMGIRAFTLKQVGDEAVFEQAMGPKFPFPPRNVLVDIHRAFFKRLPAPPGGFPDGVHEGELDEERVVETWRGGELRERAYHRPSFRPGAVRVTYGPGCRADRCEPATVRIDNGWFGYRLDIENRSFTPLAP